MYYTLCDYTSAVIDWNDMKKYELVGPDNVHLFRLFSLLKISGVNKGILIHLNTRLFNKIISKQTLYSPK